MDTAGNMVRPWSSVAPCSTMRRVQRCQHTTAIAQKFPLYAAFPFVEHEKVQVCGASSRW
eukprot:5842220-Amphidinium_carterae.2